MDRRRMRGDLSLERLSIRRCRRIGAQPSTRSLRGGSPQPASLLTSQLSQARLLMISRPLLTLARRPSKNYYDARSRTSYYQLVSYLNNQDQQNGTYGTIYRALKISTYLPNLLIIKTTKHGDGMKCCWRRSARVSTGVVSPLSAARLDVVVSTGHCAGALWPHPHHHTLSLPLILIVI